MVKDLEVHENLWVSHDCIAHIVEGLPTVHCTPQHVALQIASWPRLTGILGSKHIQAVTKVHTCQPIFYVPTEQDKAPIRKQPCECRVRPEGTRCIDVDALV